MDLINDFDLTIGISTWNRAAELNNLLTSIFEDTFSKGKFEIIIADSHSVDGTTRVIEQYVNKGCIKHIHVENTPVLKRNYILENARGKVVVLLDDDVTICHGFLNAHYDACFTHKNAFLCGQVKFREKLVEKSNYYQFRDDQHSNKKANYSKLSFNQIVTMNLSSLKENFARVGLFDTSFIGYGCEDTEYGYRLMQKGFEMLYLSDAITYHDERSTNIVEYGKKLYLTGLYGSRMLKIRCKGAWDKLYKKKMLLKFIFIHFLNKEKMAKRLLNNDSNKNKYNYNLYKVYLYICFFEGVNDQKKYNLLSIHDKEKEW